MGIVKEDLTYRTFGRWTVLERDWFKAGNMRGSFWICLCRCGSKKSVSRHSLIRGASLSCGCIQNEN